MAKRKSVTPPPITEVLLKAALGLYEQEKRIETLGQTAYYHKASGKRFESIAKTLEKLDYHISRLSSDEFDALFMFVMPAHEAGANLLLGDPIYEGPYGFGHDLEHASERVRGRIHAALDAYKHYRFERADGWGGGVIGNYAYTKLLVFLMQHWEKTTGNPVTFSRDHRGDSPKGITKWLHECLSKLAEKGAVGLGTEELESRAVQVYKDFLLERSND